MCFEFKFIFWSSVFLSEFNLILIYSIKDKIHYFLIIEPSKASNLHPLAV